MLKIKMLKDMLFMVNGLPIILQIVCPNSIIVYQISFSSNIPMNEFKYNYLFRFLLIVIILQCLCYDYSSTVTNKSLIGSDWAGRYYLLFCIHYCKFDYTQVTEKDYISIIINENIWFHSLATPN